MSGSEILNDGINVFGRDAEGASRGFVVADHNVEEVKAHVGRNPDLLQKTLDAEKASEKPRSSLVEWLEGQQAAKEREAKEREAKEREEAEAEAAAAEEEATRAAAASKPVGDGEDVNPAS